MKFKSTADYIRYLFTFRLTEKIIRFLNIQFPYIFHKLVPNNYQYNKKSFRNFKYKHLKFHADISDYMAHYIYFGFKDLSLENMLNYIKPNDVIIDVGTNIGCSLLNFASKTGIDGKVYGFEPDPFNFNSCKKNILLNNYNNIEIHNIGLGNEAGEFKMIVENEFNRGMNKIANNYSSNNNTFTVTISTLDSFVEKNNINKIDIIKIDVEGYDLKVLQGAIKTIIQFKPIIFVEIDNHNLEKHNNNAIELISFLKSINYNCLNLITKEKIEIHQNLLDCHFDVVCMSYT